MEAPTESSVMVSLRALAVLERERQAEERAIHQRQVEAKAAEAENQRRERVVAEQLARWEALIGQRVAESLERLDHQRTLAVAAVEEAERRARAVDRSTPASVPPPADATSVPPPADLAMSPSRGRLRTVLLLAPGWVSLAVSLVLAMGVGSAGGSRVDPSIGGGTTRVDRSMVTAGADHPPARPGESAESRSAPTTGSSADLAPVVAEVPSNALAPLSGPTPPTGRGSPTTPRTTVRPTAVGSAATPTNCRKCLGIPMCTCGPGDR